MNKETNHFDSLFINVHLATMDPSSYGIITDAALGIRNGKIAWLGKQTDLPQNLLKTAKKTYDGKGKWITPGLIDCHTHLVYAGSRVEEFEMRKKGISYAEIAKKGGGIKSTVKATRDATEKELFTLAKKRVEQLIKDGVTTVEIKSGYGLDRDTEIKILRVAAALEEELGINIKRTFLGAHTIPEGYSADKYIDFLSSTMLPEIKKKNLADSVDAFCETIAFNTSQVEKLFNASQKLGFSLKIHAEQLSNQHGAELAAKYKALSADHLEYIDEKGVKALAKSGTVAVLLPGAAYYLQEKQKPPISLFRKHNVPMAIATDLNPGTSPINSLLTILNMACVLFGFTPEEALRAVTINAARALGIEKTTGTLEVDKNADLVLWNIKHPAELSYGINLKFEKMVICQGRALYDSISSD